MQSNTYGTSRDKIEDFVKRARDSINEAIKLADETGISFNYAVGDYESTYIPRPVGEELTQKKALQLLKDSDYLNPKLKDKVIRVLSGEIGIKYTDDDIWESSSEYGWNAS